ncbi:hotdog domain-containing protein [Erythrobacter sp. Alg231-14]|uniref:hotdog domain-containing protein n=1 Tax=Erythrobacter sp. Alg231-14 TaxID=1922225 RepID=UPI000D559C4A
MAEHPFEYRTLSADEAGGEDDWFTWNLVDRTRYNSAVLGDMQVRREGSQCRLRMFPERRHTNLVDNIHGATTLGLIDIALFATMHTVGNGDAGPSVTVELSSQFIGAGDPNRPLDAVSEIVRETGRMLFLRGQCVQGDDIVASYSGIVRKMRSRNSESLSTK